MELITTVLLGGFLVVLFLVLRGRRASHQSKPFPPGPSGWIVLWDLIRVRRDYLRFKRLVPYGEIASSPASQGKIFVVLNSYRSIQEAFVNQGDIYAGRPSFPYLDLLTHKAGIIFTDGPIWQEHRRFTLRTLRDFGVGRSGAEEIVSEESAAIRERLESAAEQAQGVDCRAFFTQAINNVIARLTFGERCGTDDPNFADFVKNLDDTLALNTSDLLPFIFPFIVKIPPLLRLVEVWSQWRRKSEKMHDYIRQKIDEHEEELKMQDMASLEPTNVCDAYLVERNKQQRENPGQHTYTDWQLIRNTIELFLAGTETTATTLTWAVLMLSQYPEVQKKAQGEVFEIIGRNQAPRMSDRPHMPYLCALMDEVLRYSSLVASNVAHRNLVDTELLGYFIPADSFIHVNFYHLHHDPELWERPEELYPEHFLTEEGNYKPSKYLLPFSVGKRACLGESLARMELFMMLATVLQNFQVRLEDPSANVEDILRGRPGALRCPLQHNIIFSKLGDD